jgi:predicted alpha/beta-fold hydrolase
VLVSLLSWLAHLVLQETDLHTGVLYHGYKDLTQFYTEMSSILAYPEDETFDLRSANESRHRIPIPHAVLQAMDDPISTWRSNAASSPRSALYPGNLVAEVHQGNIILLLTRIGGHVGWPIGPLPGSWEFMNDMFAAGFISAYDDCCKKQMPGATNSILFSRTSFPI